MGRMLKAFSSKGAIKKVGCVFVIGLFLFLFTTTAWSAIADYVGTYYGTYTGADNGYWIAIVENTGNVGFLAWSNTTKTMDSDDEGITINPDTGNFNGTTYFGNTLSGTIDDVTGDVDGTWTGGLLTGQRFGPADIAQFVGSYNGNYTGADTGTWSMTVIADGTVTGTFTSNTLGSFSFIGGINPDGRAFLIEPVEGDVGASGTIVNGVVNGTWSDSWEQIGGTFTGQASGGGGGGDGGGGGCFISTLSR